MQIGVQNVTLVSTSYEQMEKDLFNYTNYKYKTKIESESEEGKYKKVDRVMEDLHHQRTRDYVLLNVTLISSHEDLTAVQWDRHGE
jgi:hypothetical protein